MVDPFDWTLNGNAGTNPSNNFVGTTDNQPLVIRTNATEGVRVDTAEIHENRLRIAGGSPGQKVSWQVTGVRRDAWARANPLVVEEDKSADDRGRFLHPRAHGHPADCTVAHAHYAKAQGYLTRR